MQFASRAGDAWPLRSIGAPTSICLTGGLRVWLRGGFGGAASPVLSSALPVPHGPGRAAASPACRGGPLRTPRFPWGVPHLPPGDQAKVLAGNATARHTARAIRLLVQLRVPAMLENPSQSMLFAAPPLARLRRAPGFLAGSLDACAYGARWRKRTTIWGWGVGAQQPSLFNTCAGHGGWCSHSGRRHVILTGTDRSTGRTRTSLAARYPPRLAQAFADLLINAARHAQLAALLTYTA